MTIAQSLKEKNIILNTIKKTKEKIHKYNQFAKDVERPYDVTELVSTLISEQDKLVAIKTAIHIASNPVRQDIFNQSELKDRLSFLRGVPNQNGVIRDRYSSAEGQDVNSTYGPREIDDMIESLELKISSTQDMLDKFNHNTEVVL
jgi:hypothetical protein